MRAFRRGVRLSRERRFAEAIVEFEEAIVLAPSLVSARLNLGSAYYQMSAERSAGHVAGWLDEADRRFREVLSARPDLVPAALNLAAVQHARGDAAAALAILEELARREPTHRDVQYNLAIARWQTGDLEGARRAARAELAVHPDHPQAGELLARLGPE